MWCSNCVVSSSKTLVFCQQRIPQGHPSFLSRCMSFASHSPSICYAFTRRRINNCIFYRLFLSAQALQESHRSLGKRGHCHEAVSIRTRTNYSLIVSLQVHCNDYGCIHSFWVIRVMTYKGHQLRFFVKIGVRSCRKLDKLFQIRVKLSQTLSDKMENHRSDGNAHGKSTAIRFYSNLSQSVSILAYFQNQK